MHRKENKNYFAILGIEPTMDYQKVREAYKRALMKNHPDVNNGDDTKAKAIIEAWSELKDPIKLRQYYLQYLKGDGVEERQEEIAFPPREMKESELTTLVKPGEKFVVFIPLLFSYNEANLDAKDIDMLSLNDVKKGRQIDFNMLAESLTNMLDKYSFRQVGIDTDEVRTIINQHSFLRYSRGCYAVEVAVNLCDLNVERQTEKDLSGPNVLSARSDHKFFSLKNGTKISVGQIISIQLGCDFGLENSFEVERKTQFNNNSTYPQLVLERKKPTPFEECIFDNKFWSHFKLLGNVPEGIKQIQKCIHENGVHISDAWQIATKEIEAKKNFFSISEPKEVMAFYKMIKDANSLPDLQAEVEAFYRDNKGYLQSKSNETKLLK